MEEFFFALIRVSIGRKESLPKTPSSVEWKKLFDLAQRHAITGICFGGVQKVKSQDQVPTRDIHNEWRGQALQIYLQNEKMNKRCIEAGHRVQAAGFQWCILKGQGIAQLYGEGLCMLRQSGDIDLWVDCGMKRALSWAKDNYNDVPFDYINAHVPMFRETEVELHWRVRSMANIFLNLRLQKWMEAHKNELLCTTIELPNGVGVINVPSLKFNRFYILLHCYNHLFSEGLGLRQIMDLYYVLNQGIIKDELPLEEFGLLKFAKAMMWIMGYVFRLEREKMLCEPDEKEGRYVLSEIMMNGNMGHHDSRIKIISKNARVQTLASRIQHNWHLVTHYPSEFLWTHVWMVWHYVWKKISKLRFM